MRMQNASDADDGRAEMRPCWLSSAVRDARGMRAAAGRNGAIRLRGCFCEIRALSSFTFCLW